MVLNVCLSADALGRYAAGTLSAPDAESVGTHLSQCSVCLARLDGLVPQSDPLVQALRRVTPAPPAPSELVQAMNAVLSGKSSAQRRAEAPSAVGKVVGGYRIVGELGAGGMGRVYRAVHPRLDQEVALKVLRRGMDSAPIVARFEAERQTLALMDHPHVARVADGGVTEEGQPFFVMELVRGVSITRYCDQRRLGLPRRLELFIDVCQAVQHAHQKGIIHRDLKPSNVLVAEYDGRASPKVIDFGVARAVQRPLEAQTEAGMLIGTLDYMSPEQADLSSTDVDTRSDVYALGAMLYELLTGAAPHAWSDETSILERLRRIREDEPLAPSVRLSQMRSAERGVRNEKNTPHSAFHIPHSRELDWVVLKALEKDRSRRYQSAAALAEDLRRFLHSEPLEAGPPSNAYRLRKFVRRNRAAIAVAAGFALLLVSATILSSSLAWWANDQRIRAESAEGKERDSRRSAEDRLKQIERVNTILAEVFRDINPRGVDAPSDETLRIRLGQRLDAAAAQISADAIGDPATVANLQERLGLAQLSLGYVDKALALLTTAAESREKLHGPDDERTLEARIMLSTALHAANRTPEMIETLEDVIRRHQSQPRPTHDLLVLAVNNLSTGYLAAGRIREAIKLAEQSLQVRVDRLGAGHPTTAASRNSLALACSAAGDKARAIGLVEENLALQVTDPGPDHPETISTRNNLASLYLSAGRFQEALPLFEQLLAHRVRTLGSDHPDTLISRANLAECYRALQRTDEALAMHAETLKLRKRILGPLNPQTLRSQNQLAEAYVQAKRLDEAIPLHEETLEQRRSALGANHPDTLSSRDHLAIAYRRAGRAADAIALHVETLARRKATLGEDHPDTQRSAGNLANAYLTDDQHQQAADVYRELLASRRRTLPADSSLLVDTCSAFGMVLLKLQKGPEAEPLFRDCLSTRQQQDPDGWNTLNTKAHLGESLMVQRKFAAAEGLLIEAYEAMHQRLGQDPAAQPARVSQIAGRLVQLYEAWQKPEEAAQWRARQNPPATNQSQQ